ncbi:hypothetical protein [Yoonia vestfoldensis]|jgi:hypothetical protein|uniref:Uncharacterized protein n=1 Tax=Yoonia vestfoldensis TaxID=245188 RepID=A0A1Y0EBP1_9RHOB|nr:hypothetical protein [Yoonia vestfoldensis]ARU01025.1 hypothetical protein LOKVESSMR4R_01711 [Yoonia vestfoldensis]
MDDKVITLRGQRRAPPPPASDFWFAQVDLRLGRIESTVARLAWHIWIAVCTGAALLVLEIVKALSKGIS